MDKQDSLAIGNIYENLDFKSSYSNVDPQIERVKAQANEVCHALEHKIEGLINYYKMTKTEFFNNPRDMNALKKLENMLKHLREPLYPYQEFRG